LLHENLIEAGESLKKLLEIEKNFTFDNLGTKFTSQENEWIYKDGVSLKA